MNRKKLALLGLVPALALGTVGATSSPADAAPTKVKVRGKAEVKKKAPRPSTVRTRVRLRDIKSPLVPSKLIRGDREFDGNGPDITSSVTLRVGPRKKAIYAFVSFSAVETKGDRSTTRQSWRRKVYDAPRGRTIEGIEGPVTSSVRFRSVKGGFQFLVPGTDARKFFLGLSQLADKVEEAERKLAMKIAASERRKLNDFLTKIRQAKAFMPFQGNHVHTVAPKTKGPVSVFAIVGDTGGPDISDDNNPKDDTRIQAITFNPLTVKLSR